jgi:hypothetical protein
MLKNIFKRGNLYVYIVVFIYDSLMSNLSMVCKELIIAY